MTPWEGGLAKTISTVEVEPAPQGVVTVTAIQVVVTLVAVQAVVTCSTVEIVLRGGFNFDRLEGKAGKDSLHAADGVPFETVDGGTGKDICQADLLDVVISC